MRSTIRSQRNRKAIRSAMVAIFSPWNWAKRIRSGVRAIVPSSFMTSQMTPDGVRPARRAMSTPASVWPARTSTPPSRASSGNTWPGETISSGPFVASMATAIVRARSEAEMPVVTPSRASIEMVKAVWCREALRLGISGSFSSLTRARVSARQISPRPYLAMKLIAAGVAICAGMTRSPSFSRFSSSIRMNIRPLRASSMMSSMLDSCAGRSKPSPVLNQAGNISRQQVDFQVHPVARPGFAEGSDRERVRNDVDPEPRSVHLVDGQRNAVDGDRPLRGDEAGELSRRLEDEAARGPFRRDRHYAADAIDVAGDDMPAQLVADPESALEIHRRTRPPFTEGGAPQRRRRGMDGKPAGFFVDHRQAHARAGDRRADRDGVVVETAGDLDAGVAVVANVPHASEVGDDAGEHAWPERSGARRRCA